MNIRKCSSIIDAFDFPTKNNHNYVSCVQRSRRMQPPPTPHEIFFLKSITLQIFKCPSQGYVLQMHYYNNKIRLIRCYFREQKKYFCVGVLNAFKVFQHLLIYVHLWKYSIGIHSHHWKHNGAKHGYSIHSVSNETNLTLSTM